jgi:Family of unknown function (DUF5939)
VLNDAGCAAAIEGAVNNAPDQELCRVNALAFAAKNKLDEERTIAAFLHAARLGLFELSWNVLCPDCGGVLDAGTTLKTVNHDEYSCALCAAGYKPTLDEMVEVTFTVNPRVRRIAGHDPDTLLTCNSFYMATVSESGWPYVQHRGGPVAQLAGSGQETDQTEDHSLAGSMKLPASFSWLSPQRRKGRR